MQAAQVINIDEALIEQCRSGIRSAQYEVYKRYQKAMYNTALRICGDREDAEDILQESFFTAFNQIKQYRGESSFGSWLKRIVINKSLNAVNKKQKESLMIADKLEEQTEECNDYIDEQLLTVNRIKEAIHMLPVGYRTVLSLYLFEGYDHQEIAQILGTSVSNSKSQLNRSKEKIRELLKLEKNYG